MSSIGPSEPTASAEHPAAGASYDPFYFAPLFAAEDRHFWFRARNRVIESLVEQITVRLAPGYRALEVGCGTGNVLRVLQRACPGGAVVGMDLWSAGLRYARQRATCPLVQGELRIVPILNTLLASVLMQEARLIKRRHVLPIGTAIVAVARADGSIRPP